MAQRLLWALAGLAMILFLAERLLRSENAAPDLALRDLDVSVPDAEPVPGASLDQLDRPDRPEPVLLIPPLAQPTEPDPALVRRAAADETEAQEELGVFYWLRDQPDKAVPLFRRAARKGNAQSHALLSEYNLRSGKPQDRVRSVAHYWVAAEIDRQFETLRMDRIAAELSPQLQTVAEDMARRMIADICAVQPSALDVETCQ